MEKWAQKRATIEKEAREIREALGLDDSRRIFDEMMGDPIKTLEELMSVDA
jgi:hypothetical protein